jgi:hypothetical protein
MRQKKQKPIVLTAEQRIFLRTHTVKMFINRFPELMDTYSRARLFNYAIKFRHGSCFRVIRHIQRRGHTRRWRLNNES